MIRQSVKQAPTLSQVSLEILNEQWMTRSQVLDLYRSIWRLSCRAFDHQTHR